MSALIAAVLLAAPTFEPCRIGAPGAGPRIAADCAQLVVPENPAEPDGRQVALALARLKTLSGDDEKAPLVFIAGGPGQSALETYPGVASAFEEIRRERDILLVDQRGTGKSNPLQCPSLAQEDDMAGFEAEAVRAAAADCVRELDADLRFYTTIDAVRDLEAVRQALGHDRFVLYGVSYGTRVAQEYLRRHPDRVEAMILDGVTVPGETLGPEIAADAQRALDLMIERCAVSVACAERFPRLGERIAEMQSRLEERSLRVDLRDPFTGERTEIELTWPRAAMLLRMYSYAPETVALLPLLVSQAAAGDWQGFAGNVLALERQSESLLYIGMHNSVVCSEDAPWFSSSGAEEPAYLGTLTTDLIDAMCAAWPTRELPADFREPVTSEVPVLLLSGEADPVTPPENAAEVESHFDNARHLVAPGQGHGIAWRGCAPKLMATFLEEQDPDGLDAGCLQELAAFPFFIDRNGPQP